MSPDQIMKILFFNKNLWYYYLEKLHQVKLNYKFFILKEEEMLHYFIKLIILCNLMWYYAINLEMQLMRREMEIVLNWIQITLINNQQLKIYIMVNIKLIHWCGRLVQLDSWKELIMVLEWWLMVLVWLWMN